MASAQRGCMLAGSVSSDEDTELASPRLADVRIPRGRSTCAWMATGFPYGILYGFAYGLPYGLRYGLPCAKVILVLRMGSQVGQRRECSAPRCTEDHTGEQSGRM